MQPEGERNRHLPVIRDGDAVAAERLDELRVCQRPAVERLFAMLQTVMKAEDNRVQPRVFIGVDALNLDAGVTNVLHLRLTFWRREDEIDAVFSPDEALVNLGVLRDIDCGRLKRRGQRGDLFVELVTLFAEMLRLFRFAGDLCAEDVLRHGVPRRLRRLELCAVLPVVRLFFRRRFVKLDTQMQRFVQLFRRLERGAAVHLGGEGDGVAMPPAGETVEAVFIHAHGRMLILPVERAAEHVCLVGVQPVEREHICGVGAVFDRLENRHASSSFRTFSIRNSWASRCKMSRISRPPSSALQKIGTQL